MNPIRFFLLLVFIAFASCNSPEKDILGKWKLVHSANHGFDEPDDRKTVIIYDFISADSLIRYYNGEPLGFKYELKGDSLYGFILYQKEQRLVMRSHCSIINDTLTLDLPRYTYLQFTRTNKITRPDTNMNVSDNFYVRKPENRKGIRKILSTYGHSYTWKPQQGPKLSYPVALVFSNRGEISYSFTSQCTYYFDALLSSDSTIDLVWIYSMDDECMGDSLDLGFRESNGIQKYPHYNDIFSTYTLINDSTMRVTYNFHQWVKKVNQMAHDSIFPRYLYHIKEQE